MFVSLHSLFLKMLYESHNLFVDMLPNFKVRLPDYFDFWKYCQYNKKMDVWVLIFICSIAFIVKERERERESFKNLYLLFPYYLVYWEHEHQSHLPIITLFLINSIFLANAPTPDLMKYHYWVTSLFQLPSLLADWS